MYKLSLETVKEKAREYYDNKKLTAQNPNPNERMCVNKSGDYRCAVAASFPDEVLNHDFGPVEEGVKLGLLQPPDDPVEWARIVRLQQAHDYWADAAQKWPDNKEMLEKFENAVKYHMEY